MTTSKTAQAPKGLRFYVTTPALEAKAIWLDCNVKPRRFERMRKPVPDSALAALLIQEDFGDLDTLDEGLRARLVGIDAIEADDRDGYVVFIVRYTGLWHYDKAEAARKAARPLPAV